MMKEDNHVFQGMRRDNHEIKQDAKFLWNAHNIRLTNRDDNTLLSITNEKGTKDTRVSFNGTYVGHCVLGKYLVVFTTKSTTEGTTDYIYRVKCEDGEYKVTMLYGKWPYNTSLGFDPKHPIEAFGDYETDLVQKVYWVDGIHQPRVINIMEQELKNDIILYPRYTNTSFDFIPTLKLEEKIEVTKSYEDGLFSPGTIQYAFTYYNKYGQESNIFYTTPLYYISPKERGGSPEDRVQNAFNIKISNNEYRFDYIRIYSIHRTSVDAVPTVLKVGDVKTKVVGDVYFTDTGTIGEVVDPTKLLYIGGEEIVAGTICAKDHTLFLGNIELKRDSLYSEDNIISELEAIEVTPSTKYIEGVSPSLKSSYYDYKYSMDNYNAYFKSGEYYRLGLQFQYKTGKWSEPIFIKDIQMDPSMKPGLNSRPIFKLTLPKDKISYFTNKNYKKVRAVRAQSTNYDRTIIAQGILCPTVFNVKCRLDNAPFVQSSWFMRPTHPGYSESSNNKGNYQDGAVVQFGHLQSLYPNTNRGGELQCSMTSPSFSDVVSAVTSDAFSDQYNNVFMVDQSIVTFHSPDIEFDDAVKTLLKESEYKIRLVGLAQFTSCIGDIDIQTSTPTAGLTNKGFVHRQIGNTTDGSKGLVAGLFYYDSIIAKTSNKESGVQFFNPHGSYGYMVYPWNKLGSLNNDTARPDGTGTRTAELRKKVISNLRFSKDNLWFSKDKYWSTDKTQIQLFDSNEVSLIKIKAPASYKFDYLNYYGNVDTMVPDSNSPSLIDLNGTIQIIPETLENVEGEILNGTNESVRLKYKSTPHAVFSINKNDAASILPVINLGDVKLNVKPFWVDTDVDLGATNDKIIEVTYFGVEESGILDPREGQYWVKTLDNGYEQVQKYVNGKWQIDMEYVNKDKYFYYKKHDIYWKEIPYGPHQRAERVTLKIESQQEIISIQGGTSKPYLFIAEIYKEKPDNIFGGDSAEAKQNNLWIPASKPYNLLEEEKALEKVEVEWEYGDTWYSRYDCLKTYPFTLEDENQVVEIGSFMCETRVNIDGRYDKNRGQVSNLNMTPRNFNLLNEIYSQKDNFFNYRILDKDYYKQHVFANQITWSKEKSAGEEIDPWTNITLANTLDMGGDKGKITTIKVWNEHLLCLQEKALSQILFNSRVQIPTTDGVPIEISNGYKVDGSRLLSGTIGCSNKWATTATATGIYFLDSNTDSIYVFNGELTNLSENKGMDWWVSQNHTNKVWAPTDYGENLNGIRLFYDSKYGDLYFTPGPTLLEQPDALCYSEYLGQFTSFMSYGGTQAMFNIIDGFYSLRQDGNDSLKLYQNNMEDYNNFYGTIKGWDFSFISNQDPTLTKIFDTVELRTDHYWAFGTTQLLNSCPMNFIEVDNEYQHSGKVPLDNKNIRKKFRIWRSLIPRNKGTRQRIRNPWSMITLGWAPNDTRQTGDNTKKAIIHDVSVKYTV